MSDRTQAQTVEKPDVCYYHFPCLDGFGAALAVHQRWPDVQLRPINYGGQVAELKELADMSGKHVLFVDFFPGAAAVNDLMHLGCRVTVLDHHKTAQAEAAPMLAEGKVAGVFDMERSGAGITWDILHGGGRPRMIELLEDRDIWRWAHGEDSRNFHAFIASQPYDLATWGDVLDSMEDPLEALNLLEQGRAIRRKHGKDIGEYIDQLLQWWLFDSRSDAQHRERPGQRALHSGPYFRVPVLNIPYTHGSEACHELLGRFPDAPFAAYYVDAGAVRRWGFRSEDERVDVSAVAKVRGGGGHRNASGCEEVL